MQTKFKLDKITENETRELYNSLEIIAIIKATTMYLVPHPIHLPEHLPIFHPLSPATFFSFKVTFKRGGWRTAGWVG